MTHGVKVKDNAMFTVSWDCNTGGRGGSGTSQMGGGAIGRHNSSWRSQGATICS